MADFRKESRYIDCDYIWYKGTDGKIKCHPYLFDYNSMCNAGLWRDGSFGNALIAMRHGKRTEELHVIKGGKEILVITKDTPEEMYYREVTA